MESGGESRKKQLLENLEELLSFGGEVVRKIPFPQEEAKLKEDFLLTATTACINYSRAILLLAENGLTIPAIALLRSIVELVFYNVTYALEDDTINRVANFHVSDLYTRKRHVQNLIRLLSDAETSFLTKDMGIEGLKELEKRFEREISEIEQVLSEKHSCKLELKPWPSVAEIAIAIDKSKGEPDAQKLYRLGYWFYSSMVHLDSRGLAQFEDGEDTMTKLVLEGKRNYFQDLITYTYAHNVTILGRCKEIFGVPTEEELEEFRETRNLMFEETDEPKE